MKQITQLIIASFATLLMFSCSGKKDMVKIQVASATVDCMGAFPQQCLLVKIGNDTEWTYFYSNIEGFDYEPGYEYVLEVKQEKVENPAMDSSSIKYRLVKEISKTAKVSDNLPPAVTEGQPTEDIEVEVVEEIVE